MTYDEVIALLKEHRNERGMANWAKMDQSGLKSFGIGLTQLRKLLVLAGHESGNEIQSPMAQVILGGLLSSTFLNLVIVPALFASGGRGGDRS